MTVMAGFFIMIGLFTLGNDICRAARILADAIRTAHGIKGDA